MQAIEREPFLFSAISYNVLNFVHKRKKRTDVSEREKEVGFAFFGVSSSSYTLSCLTAWMYGSTREKLNPSCSGSSSDEEELPSSAG